MAIVDAILQKPKVVVLLGTSSSGISANLYFGTVYNIFETSDKFAINDSVMFDPEKAVQIGDDTSNNYYLLDESDLLLTEVVVLPP